MNRFLLLLLALIMLGPLGIDLYLPQIPSIAETLQAKESIIQSSISLYIFVLGVGQLFSGPLVDRYGRRPVAIFGVSLYIAGALLAAFAWEVHTFMLSRVIQGLAVCCTSVVIFTSVRDRLSGENAAKAFGFLGGTLNIVPALAPLIGGIISQYYGWRAPFISLSAYAIIMLVIVIRFLPETRPINTQIVNALPFKEYGKILSSVNFILFAIANAGAMGMILTYMSLAPGILMGTGSLSLLEFSLLFGLNGLWIMFMSALANRIIPRIGRPSCLAIGYILMAAGSIALLSGSYFIPLPFQSSAYTYMLPVAFGCSGLAFIIGPATSYALEDYSNNAGIASALVGLIQMGGGASLCFFAIMMPVPPKMILATVMLIAAVFAFFSQQRSKLLVGLNSDS